ncbi:MULTISPECIES: three-Cys-motif partner protein TcmP [unclassified Caballeronia]|uniref:three-Cys-motif partner protein TcmP n=1 Tax=unclassified Caballeronia TaxID=2646786 RepID=UPI002027C734|nr:MULTISPECIES: three-Cys-motif partner protein TcmP [unclassified Caballeronia]
MNEKVRVDPADGLPAMVVGSWAQGKHEKLTDYVGASWGARARFPGSSYIDLFCGPGRVVEREHGAFRDGGALAAWKTSCAYGKAPFHNIFIGDLSAESVKVCEQRLTKLGGQVRPYVGAATKTVHEIVSDLPRGLHLAFLDPFNAKHLDFEIILALAAHPNIDILVHFSVMDIQRNIDLEAAKDGTRLECIAPGWREAIDLSRLPRTAFVGAFLDYWQRIVLNNTRMTAASTKPLLVNSKNGPLYRLILLSRHIHAQKLWNDVGRENKDQRDLFGSF